MTTAEPARRDTGRTAPPVAGALTRLLGATDVDRFADAHWGRALLLSPVEERGGDRFTDLFGLADVDELLSRRGLRTPFVRMAKDGRTLPDAAFTGGGGVGAGIADQVDEDKVMRQFDQGATIVLQGLHRTWEPVAAFTGRLADELGHPVQANAYVTPAQSQGFSAHYDVHDVFVLQVHGTKEWTVHAPVHRAPLRDEPWTDHRGLVERAAAREPLLRAVLRPGDSLYLPRGFLHSARALGGVTAHLTLGVQQWTRHHLAEELASLAVAQLRRAEAARESLPLGVDVTDPADLADDLDRVRARLVAALQEIPAERLAQALRPRVRAGRRAAPLAPIAQLDAVPAVTSHTRIRLREGLALHCSALPDQLVEVSSRAGSFRMPARLRPALDRLTAAAGEEAGVPVGDLDPDDDAARSAAKLLLRAGVAVLDRA